MMLVDPEPARLSATQPHPDGVTIERLAGVEGPDAEAAASAIVEVLIDAFEVDPERRPAIEGETVASLSASVVHPLPHPRRRRARGGRPARDVRGRHLPVVDRDRRLGARSWPRDDRHADGRVRGPRRRQRVRLPRGLRRQLGRHRRLPAIRVPAGRVVLSRHAPLVTGTAHWIGSWGRWQQAPSQHRPIALGWATVDLDRAAAELAAELGLAVAAFLPAADSIVLGARCRVADGVLPGGARLAILEPRTEGRLAAALARHGEGPSVTWAQLVGRSQPTAGIAPPGAVRSGAPPARRATPGSLPAPHRGRAGYHPHMTDQATILFRPAATRRRRGDRRDVHGRGLSRRPERHHRQARALRHAGGARHRRRARGRAPRLHRHPRIAPLRARRLDRPHPRPRRRRGCPRARRRAGR